MFLDQFISFKREKEFHMRFDFLDNINEKLHTIHKQINCTLVCIYRNLYHSEGTDLQLNICYTYIFIALCLINQRDSFTLQTWSHLFRSEKAINKVPLYLYWLRRDVVVQL